MGSFWIDAHCHLTDDRLTPQTLADMLARSEAHGIPRWFLGGIDPKEWQKQREILNLRPGRVYRSIGLHPWWVASASTESIQQGLNSLRQELRAPKSPIHAVGELGLDRSSRLPPESLPAQIEAFRAQLMIAQEFKLPLVLHIVRAHDEALKILKTARPLTGGMVHSYSGSFESAKEYLKLGFILSFSSTVTHPGREKLAQVITRVPEDSFTLESDSPDQPPAGWPSPLNEPSSLIPLAETVAKLRDPSGKTGASAILDQSARNLERVFRLN